MYNVYMSPVVRREGRFSLVVRTKEQGHLGRPHVHVEASDAEASVDLVTFEILESHGFDAPSLNKISKLVQKYAEELNERWGDLHGEG